MLFSKETRFVHRSLAESVVVHGKERYPGWQTPADTPPTYPFAHLELKGRQIDNPAHHQNFIITANLLDRFLNGYSVSHSMTPNLMEFGRLRQICANFEPLQLILDVHDRLAEWNAFCDISKPAQCFAQALSDVLTVRKREQSVQHILH